jgi:hypothetical protein
MKYVILICAVLFLGMTAMAQHHYDNWVHKNASDTTIVPCWNDSLTTMVFPSGSMTGMMFPDSIYCRIDRMDLDSLIHPHDSTFIGWHRIQIGRDSGRYNMMNDSMMGGQHQMQFMMDLFCSLSWDSLMADSTHRHWHPTGIRGWDGSQWVVMGSAVGSGNTATVTTAQVYSAIAFVGEPSSPTGVDERESVPAAFGLSQNYPNPFNPATRIEYELSHSAHVTLTVFNMLGQEVATLINGVEQPGHKSVSYNGNKLPSGLYIYHLNAGTFSDTKRMMLIK